jgi:phosphopantothenoylcysteine decarboxylase/phosphopantothenate--cysteine ligase
LEKTKDILESLGSIKQNQFLIGFALETENEIDNAKLKVQKKNLDLIVLNSLQDKGAGFGVTTNKVTFIDSNFNVSPMELKSKEEVANDILIKIIAHYEA